MIQDRWGLTMPEVERLTGKAWSRVMPDDNWPGPGAYVWASEQGKGETLYPGKSRYVLARLAAEAGWSEDADHLGYEAVSRLICRYACVAFYCQAASEDEARDVEGIDRRRDGASHGTSPSRLGIGLAAS